MTIPNGAVLVFFALALIYAVLFLFCLVRLRKLHSFSPEWRHSQCFYCILTLQSALRAVLFLVLCFDAYHWRNLTVFCLISTPDSLFMVTYLLMFWQLLSVFYYAHAETQGRKSFLRSVAAKPHKSLPSLLFVGAISVWVAVQTSLYLTMEVSEGREVSMKIIWIEVGIANVVVATTVLCTMVTLQLSYSGHPLRSASWNRKLRKMNVSVAAWSFGRLCDGVLSLCDSEITTDIETMVSSSDTSSQVLFSAGLLVSYLIVCEVLCMFFVLDYSYMAIFVFSESNAEIGPELNPPLLQSAQIEAMLDDEKPLISEYPMFADFPTINEGEIKLVEAMIGRKNGLGKLFRGEYREREVACRKIELPRISHYVVEEFNEEVEVLATLDAPYLLPYYGALIHGPTLSLFSPYIVQGSLYTTLHHPSLPASPLSPLDKLTLAYRVSLCLASLHSKSLPHGHLSSHNILLGPGFHPYISDFGLVTLRKYAGLLVGYSSKTAWTSPELLSEKSSTPMKVHPSDDVYSFGIILWELITEKEPFPGEGRNSLFEMVVRDELRPEIPIGTPVGLRDLMISCWNKDPGKRADITIVRNSVRREMERLRTDENG